MMKHFRAPLMVAALTALSACGVFKGGGPKKTPTIGQRVPILASDNAVAVDPSLASTPVTLPAPEVNDAWSQRGGNAAKAMGQLALGAQPARLWQVAVAGSSPQQRLGAAPVVAEGKIFVVDVAAKLHALNAETGAALWTASIGGSDAKRAVLFGGGVSYDSGNVYATDGLGEVVAFSAADGKELWRSRPGGPLRGAPTVANGNVYVLTQDNQMFAVGQADGKVQWVQNGSVETQAVFGVAAPAASQGSVVVGYSSGELAAYRYENGRVLWQDALSRSSTTTSVGSLADIDASPVVEAGRVYAVGQGGRMVSLELSTGQRLWEQNLGGISTPWIAGDWLFVVTDDARLVCLSRASGKARWLAQLPQYRKPKKKSGPIIWFGPVLAGERLVMTNSLGQIVMASPADGSIVQTIETKQPFALPPVVANRTLYTFDQKGQVTAYR